MVEENIVLNSNDLPWFYIICERAVLLCKWQQKLMVTGKSSALCFCCNIKIIIIFIVFEEVL